MLNKKIWIDLTNSPHVNFFKPFIEKWEKEGFEVIITSRDLANTIDLINQNGWSFKTIGGHAGKNKLKKLLYFPWRSIALYLFLIKHRPHVGISHSSFYSPIVCSLLRIPSIYLNDNEHAKGNMIAFKFATLNLLPEFLLETVKESCWGAKYNIKFYPGIKEGIYLSQNVNLRHVSSENPIKYFIRLEPWTAEYYNGKKGFMDSLIEKLSETQKVVILARNDDQYKYYKKNARFKNLEVLLKPLPLIGILEQCSLFIGAGGTMTRELAFLGVPTMSVYQDDYWKWINT